MTDPENTPDQDFLLPKTHGAAKNLMDFWAGTLVPPFILLILSLVGFYCLLLWIASGGSD